MPCPWPVASKGVVLLLLLVTVSWSQNRDEIQSGRRPAVAPVAAGPSAARQTSFGADVAFLREHTDVIVLARGNSRLAVVPQYQGRVMTSTTGGDAGPSFGWLNDKVIERGLLTDEQRRDKLEAHIYVFGGEERFWLGPEGGQFGIYFRPGAEFIFADWHTPPPIDTEPYRLVERTSDTAAFSHACQLVNHLGTRFSVDIQRTVSLLTDDVIQQIIGQPLPDGVQAVAYQTDNRIRNTGESAWTPQSGMLSIWLLGMYKPSANTTVVIPFKAGPDARLGPRVNDAYFGTVPDKYLKVEQEVLYFKGDGTRRGKIGISPLRSKGIAGSYDADGQMLTLIDYNMPSTYFGYVNSMWELQAEPFQGDVINAYNDGSPAPGQPPLGPFYELETSSPAAPLKPGETLRHRQRTLHLVGPERQLDVITRATLGVSLNDIQHALP